MRTCNNCKHSVLSDPMHCRRFPPTVVNLQQATYPIVHADTWCGEHALSVSRVMKNWSNRTVRDKVV